MPGLTELPWVKLSCSGPARSSPARARTRRRSAAFHRTADHHCPRQRRLSRQAATAQLAVLSKMGQPPRRRHARNPGRQDGSEATVHRPEHAGIATSLKAAIRIPFRGPRRATSRIPGNCSEAMGKHVGPAKSGTRKARAPAIVSMARISGIPAKAGIPVLAHDGRFESE